MKLALGCGQKEKKYKSGTHDLRLFEIVRLEIEHLQMLADAISFPSL